MRSPLLLAYVAVGFLLTGLVINFIQLLSLIILWPISRSAYRRFNGFIVNFHWTEVIWAAEWWANVRLRVFCEKEVVASLGRDRGVALCNHASDLDWLIGWQLAHNYNILGGAKCILKHMLMYIPVLGWSWWFLEYIFIHRNWEKDKSHMAKSCAALGSFPMPFWVVIFAEGTRFTPAKQEESAAFCDKIGKPQLKHVLYPRTKGWNLVMSELRKHVDCIYDVTMAFKPGQVPDLTDLLEGHAREAYVYIRRTPIAELPEGEAACEQWCVDTFYGMDKRLAEFHELGRFAGHEEPQTRRLDSLLVLLFWTSLFTAALLYTFLPAVLAGESYALLGLAGALIFGDLFIRLLRWFAKQRPSKPRDGSGKRAAKKPVAAAD